MSPEKTSHTFPSELKNPKIVSDLFETTKFSLLWLAVRLWLGYVWLASGLEKLFNPGWVSTGDSVRAFWERAIIVPALPARPPIAFDWYREFLSFLLEGGHYSWFGKLIVLGEIAVGAALILGLFTGISAFFGAFLNWNFMMAGTASINPVMFPLSILLVIAWRVSGSIGLDRFILPFFGTPRQPGSAFKKKGIA